MLKSTQLSRPMMAPKSTISLMSAMLRKPMLLHLQLENSRDRMFSGRCAPERLMPQAKIMDSRSRDPFLRAASKTRLSDKDVTGVDALSVAQSRKRPANALGSQQNDRSHGHVFPASLLAP